ncbi:hypothetical protein [Solimonas terrae]|uniref:DUF3300 domain-containing protein n=1 Tax=Solimonas terrae TaxID=1396819 RepID=A0A6M2BNG9_9GAMM|nr:hypothetical protein [Solimonas terrae]NGY03755.1 hypothetical protein [Solimonas terrae]
MKIRIIAALLALGIAIPAMADVGVSINIGEPGFYGTIDLGGAPRPELIYAEPVMVERVAVRPAPVYLRVPPGHEKNWSHYCGAYHACGRPVYFVQDSWYRKVYSPDYRRRHGHGDDHDHDDHHDNGHGHGHGNGHGHDKGYH